MATAQSLSTPLAYHRLMRSPLDDMETFTSISDLMTYCKSGAYYDGQRVAVTLAGTNARFHYVIKDAVPLLIPEGWQPVFKTFSGTAGMLIYYYNNDHNVYATSTSKYTYLEDPYLFSLFDTVGIFRNRSDNKFYFAVEVTNRSTKALTTSTFSQTYDPMEEASSFSISSGTSLSITGLRKNRTNGGLIQSTCSSVPIIPYNAASNTYIVRIYALNAAYYTAFGGGGISG